MTEKLNLSAGPHIRDRWTTPFIMLVVLLSLVPAAVVGVCVHGLHALWIILAAIGAAILTELLFCLVTRRRISIWDGSAAVTGMLLALSLSPSTPIALPIIGSVFAILVVKCCFGGLGKNFINPALAARCFLLISFGNAMTVFPALDGVSSATPVAELMSGKMIDITSMFLGTANGVIGASVLALLIGGLVLWGLDIIHGEICFSVLASFTLVMGLFGGHGFDPKFLLAHLCGGGVVMGAFFMATDYTTSPVSRLGQFIYGCLIGVLGALFRCFGHAADSFSYSIIIANLFTPLIDTFIVQKPYAYRKSAIDKANGVQKQPLIQRIPKPVIALTLITLLAGVALSGVFTMTKDTIEASKAAAQRASFKVVLPDADADDPFVPLEAPSGVYGDGKYRKTTINEVYQGVDKNGNTVGYVFVITNSNGYSGDIKLSLGIKADGTVYGIAFTELNETPGKGSLAAEPAFKDQFNNRIADAFELNSENPNGIDAITGATITSNAVLDAVNAGLDYFNTVMKGGN